MSKQSPFRRMNIARKRVTRCRFKRLKVVDVPGTVPKEKEPETINIEDEENVNVTEPWPEKETPPQDPSLTKILDAEDAKKELEDEKEKAAEVPKDPESKAIEKEDEPFDSEDSGVNASTSIDPHTGTAIDVHPDDVDLAEKKIVGIGVDVGKEGISEPIILIERKEEGPLPGDLVIEPEAIEEPIGLDVAREEMRKEEETKEDPKKGESFTQMAINESIHNNIKERLKEGEKIAKSMLIGNQPLAHVESEDGSLAAGPTPPTDEDEPDEKKKEGGPTGITLHPKGEPNDRNTEAIVEKGRKFLEDTVNDIEGKTELPMNGLLKLETENQPALASECCSDVLNILEKEHEITEGPIGLDVDPKKLFEGLEGPSLKKGMEIGMIPGVGINATDLMFCFNCQQEHPIGYFNPEGNICLNCVQIELRRVLFEIRQKFFDPSAADHELLDEVLKDKAKDGKRLSMLETLYIARDLLQSYSPLAQREKTQIQPTKEEVPAMSSPFLITCEEMEPRVQKLTWAQLQKIARKMDVPLNQPIDWIAAQVCARIKRCDKCDQLNLGKS